MSTFCGMSRRRLQISAVVALVLGTMGGPVQSQEAESQPAAVDDPDAYAVYAAVLSSAPSGAAPVPGITLLGETRAGPAGCPGRDKIEPEWLSAFESLWRENARPRLIRRTLKLAVRYSLISSDELRQLMQNAGYDLTKLSGEQSPGSAVFSRFLGGRLTALSAVGFNEDKTRAVVVVQYDCFPSARADTTDCHEEKHVMLERKPEGWSVAQHVCSAIV